MTLPLFELHLTGIETENYPQKSGYHSRSNCTLLELKHEMNDMLKRADRSSNCTLLELKLLLRGVNLIISGCSNCTLLELKRS